MGVTRGAAAAAAVAATAAVALLAVARPAGAAGPPPETNGSGPGHGVLDGQWTLKDHAGKDVFVVEGSTIRWNRTAVSAFTAQGDRISTERDGANRRADVVDGEIRWDNGDVWVWALLGDYYRHASDPDESWSDGRVSHGAPRPPWAVEDERLCRGVEISWASCSSLPPCETCEPRDCAFAAWGDWYDAGGCLGLCFRHRRVARENNNCGRPCNGTEEESKRCLKPSCSPPEARDCALTQWAEWSECRHEQRHRARKVAQEPQLGGRPCDGALEEVLPCGVPEPDPCRLSEWGDWTSCSASCGRGWQDRMRRIVQFAGDGGLPCEGSLRHMQPCAAEACHGQDCKLGDWSDWSGCDAQRPGQRLRKREVARDAEGAGAECEGPLRETQGCPQASEPENCTLSDWGPWRECDASCGGGQTSRKRSLQEPARDGGSCEAASLRDLKPCNTEPCMASADDCLMGEWADWSACSADCEKGIRKRTRQVLRRARHDGKGCAAALEEVASCQRGECNRTDCVWADWDEWSACTATCGGGTKRRDHRLATAPSGGGRLCAVEDRSQAAPCGTQPCDQTDCVDGKWAAWSPWSACSASCGSGFRWRHRDVEDQANVCGQPAVGRAQDWGSCHAGRNSSACADVDCATSDWNEWSDCTSSCFGARERRRMVMRYRSGRGRPCVHDALKETEPCNPGEGEAAPAECQHMASDCKLGQWSRWGECPVTCGGGNQVRSRHILAPLQSGGKPCEAALAETRACGTAKCEEERCVDCRWGAWSDWSNCSARGDQRTRARRIERLPTACGRPCDARASEETSNCTSAGGSVRYCSWKDWSSWSGCSAECGAATRARQRSLRQSAERPGSPLFEVSASSGGTVCTGTQVDFEQCLPVKSCIPGCAPVDCKFEQWSDWQQPSCNGLCERHRSIEKMNNECGAPCDGVLVGVKRCSGNCSKRQDCTFSDWHPWSMPDRKGGAGAQEYRTRSVLRLATEGGADCRGPLRETRGTEGDETASPSSCVPADWADWQGCSRTCGGGWRTRAREIRQPAVEGGMFCDLSLEQGEPCAERPCEDSDCILDDWGAWSPCGGQGRQSRERSVARPPSSGGAPCQRPNGSAAPLAEARPCGRAQLDCRVSDWTAWDACDRSCGGGQQQRYRMIEVYPANGGSACPDSLRELRGCHRPPCNATDCEASDWEDWSTCSAECGVGQQQRSRHIHRPVAGAGAPCSLPLAQTRSCLDAEGNGLPGCDKVDCVWGEWSSWSDCSCTCEGGQRNRARHVERAPLRGGAPCAPHDREQIEPCGGGPCDAALCEDGEWGQWEDWERCSATCGGGVTWRTRKRAKEANECGRPAVGPSREEVGCATQPCSPDANCTFTDWEPWTGCTQSCDGVRSRARRIAHHGRGSGSWCEGASLVSEPCNPGAGEPAPPNCSGPGRTDCQLSDWGPWGECPATCGGSHSRRERRVAREARQGGLACNGSLAEVRACAQRPCDGEAEPRACLWGDWGDWDACTKCGDQRSRFRRIQQEARAGGSPCQAEAAEEVGRCPRRCDEPRYCVWGAWEKWSDCSATCGTGGRRSRQRRLALQGAAEARQLGLLFERGGTAAGGDLASRWLLSAGLRLEVLLAFALGLLCHWALARSASAGATARPAAPSSLRSARADRSLLGDLFGSSGSLAIRQGYRPVAVAPAEAGEA